MIDDIFNNDENFMMIALSEAMQGASLGEIPVGAVIVKDGEIIAKAHNLRENSGGATAHAEIVAINEACQKLGTWRLSGCELYVTLEPCPMCAGAIINARLDRVIFGAKDPRMGAFGSLINLNDYPLGYKVETKSGVLAEESLELLRDFFKDMRENN